MRVSHHADYCLPLPDGHPFPMAKYRLVREVLLDKGVLRAADFAEPAEVALAELERVHEPAYLDKLALGTLSAAEERRLGVPWSPRLWRRSRLAVQGTIDAARRALDDGVSANLAGGTHHAFADHAEGFCALNDVAVAIRALGAEAHIARAVVIDLDVHQGNGTAAIFAEDPKVVTFSMHGEKNYPAVRQRSTRDVALPDGTDGVAYLAALRYELPDVLATARADVAFYLAGVDVAAGDRYGRFTLGDADIRERDREVIGQVRAAGVPLVITLAGGYAPTARRTAELHAIVIEEAVRYA
jgi:acetoin utilization deacetylase AcuC-like enzyme